MALFRLEAKIISRGGGQSSVASAAYRTGGKSATEAAAYRAAQVLHDERTGETHDYTAKRGVLGAEIMLPASAPSWMANRQLLWNHVEIEVERRKDSQLAYDYVISIPHELSAKGRIEVVREFVQCAFVDKGFVADVAWHEPSRHDDLNVHAHVMVSMRRVENGAFTLSKDRPPEGVHPMKAWQHQLHELRLQWEIVANRHLEAEGLDVRIDHRSLEARGIDREPQPKLGPVAGKREKEGRGSHAGDDIRAVIGRNAERDQLKVELAEAVAEEAEIIDFIEARARRTGMSLTPEELGRQQLRLLEEAAKRMRLEEQEAEERLRLNAAEQLQRIDQFKAKEQAFAEEATKHRQAVEEEQERRRLDGKITSAEARYVIAVGETVSGDAYESLIRAAGAESAAYIRGQQEIREKLADMSVDGPQRQALMLQEQIQDLEYRAITDARLAGMYQVIGGREHQAQAEIRKFYAQEAKTQALQLRTQRQEILKPELQQTRTPEPARDNSQEQERRETDTQLAVRQAREMGAAFAAGQTPAEINQLRSAQQDQKAERQEFATGLQGDRRGTRTEQSAEQQPTGATPEQPTPETAAGTSGPARQADKRDLSDEEQAWVSRLEAQREANQGSEPGREQDAAPSPYRGPERRETANEMKARHTREIETANEQDLADDERRYHEKLTRQGYEVGHAQDRRDRTQDPAASRTRDETGEGKAADRDREPTEMSDRAAEQGAGESGREVSDEHRQWISRLEAQGRENAQEGRSTGKTKDGGRQI